MVVLCVCVCVCVCMYVRLDSEEEEEEDFIGGFAGVSVDAWLLTPALVPVTPATSANLCLYAPLLLPLSLLQLPVGTVVVVVIVVATAVVAVVAAAAAAAA